MAKRYGFDLCGDLLFAELTTEVDSSLIVLEVGLVFFRSVCVLRAVRKAALKNVWWDEVTGVPIHSNLGWSMGCLQDVLACDIHG